MRTLLFALTVAASLPVLADARSALVHCTSESTCGVYGKCKETFKIDEKKKRLIRILEVGGQTAEIPLGNIKWSDSALFGEFRQLGESVDGITGYMQFTFKRHSGELERYDSIYRKPSGDILSQDERLNLEADRLSRFGPIVGRIGNTLIKYMCEKSAAKF